MTDTNPSDMPSPVSLLKYFTQKRASLALLQDLLASHFDIQLALVSIETREQIGHALASALTTPQISAMHQAIVSGSFFESNNVRKWIEWFKNANLRLPPEGRIYFAGEGPTLQILRTSLIYRTIESSYFYFATTPSQDDKAEAIHSAVSEFKNAALTFSTCNFAIEDCLLFVGPVFVAKKLDDEILRSQLKIYEGFGELIDQLLSESDRARAARYSRLRSVISRSDLESRFAKLQKILLLFSRTRTDGCDYRPSILRRLATRILADSTARKKPDETEHRIPYYRAEHFGASRTIIGQLRLRMCDTYGSIEDSPSKNSDLPENSESTQLSRRLSEISDQVFTNTVDQRLENILVYRGWVFDYIGEVSISEIGKFSSFMDPADVTRRADSVVERISCAWVADLIQADIVTFYTANHRTRQVAREVTHAKSDAAHAWARSHVRHVESSVGRHEHEVSYIDDACESGVSLYSYHGCEVSVASTAAESWPGSDSQASLLPGSLIVLPVKHGKRVFGAIECVALLPFAFDEMSALLIEEFGELLGKYFVAQANARLMAEILSCTGPQKWHITGVRRFDDLAASVADYFLAHSATIWLVDTYSDRRMVLEGSANRSFGRQLETKAISLNLDDDTSVTALAIKSKRTIFGKINEHPFDDRWLSHGHRRTLRGGDFSYIAVIPIFDKDKKPIGSLTILSQRAPFGGEWEPQFTFCARTMATALADLRIIQRVLDDGLSETTHEILQLSTRIATAASKLGSTIRSQEKSNAERGITVHLDDIVEFSETLKVIAGIMSPSSFMNAYSNAQFLGTPMVHHYSSSIELRETRLRTIVNQEIENCRNEFRANGVTYAVNWDPSVDSLSLDRRCTEITLRNVLSNAIKYAPRGSEIVIDCAQESGKRKLVLRVSSFGPTMDHEEVLRVFERRFRSRAAAASNVAGRGEGLYQAEALMKAQGAKMSHTQDDRKMFKGASWQIFRMVFQY